MTDTRNKSLYVLALYMLEQTCPYSDHSGCVEDLKYTVSADGEIETFDFCKMVKQNLTRKRYETGQKNSHRNNCRKCIENIETAMIDYINDYPGAYSIVQHHRNQFGIWMKKIVEEYGEGMEYELPKTLQYENENQNTAVLLLKELHNRNGVTKKELQDKLCLKPRQVAKDLRKLDHSLIENPETADMSDYVPFRIGGQPVQVKISASHNKNESKDKNLYFKTVNTLHPIVLQENLLQAATLIQALCRNYYEYERNISLSIATDIWYQLSTYAKSRIRQVLGYDEELMTFIEIIEGDFPDGRNILYMTERDMFYEDYYSDEELLMYFVKVPDRRCNITLRDKDGTRRTLYDQSLSEDYNDERQTIYIATGRDGESVCFSISDFFGIEEASNHRG